MKNHLLTTFGLFIALLLSCNQSLLAQFNAEDIIFPVIDTTTLGLGPNQVKFKVSFPNPDNEGAFKDPPESLPQVTIDSFGLADFPPQWVYFWEFGDGTFSQEEEPVHTYAIQGDYEVRLRLVPIYSRNNEPTILRGNGDTLRMRSQIVNPTPTNFPADDRQRQILVVANWNAAKTFDTITMGVSFRNLQTLVDKNGEVKFKLPADGFTILNTRSSQAGVSIEGTAIDGDSLVLTAKFENLASNEEKTIFVDFRVEPGAGELDIENYDALGKVIFDDQFADTDGGFNFTNFLGFKVGEQNIGGSGDGIPNIEYEPQTFVGLNADLEHLKISRARDPNSIEVNPKIVKPGQQVIDFSYRINFENLGAAPVSPVKLRSFLEPQHDAGTLQNTGFNFLPLTSTLTGPAFPDGPTQPVWTFTDGDGVVFPKETGLLDYKIKSIDKNFKDGDRIVGEALIIMGADDTLNTGKVFTRVVDNRLRLPWRLGLKFGGNSQFSDFPNGITEGGFHAGVTLRKALGKLDGSLKSRRRIRSDALPSFWYQFELMYNNFKTVDTLRGRTEFDYQFLEVVPLMIRYFPKLNSGFINKGFIGISAGYKAAIPLSASIFQDELSLPGFFDGIEHIVFAEGSILNNLGAPGLSLGYRINWRLTQTFDFDATDRYYQLFVHLNL